LFIFDLINGAGRRFFGGLVGTTTRPILQRAVPEEESAEEYRTAGQLPVFLRTTDSVDRYRGANGTVI
jgi:hypothetical protein